MKSNPSFIRGLTISLAFLAVGAVAWTDPVSQPPNGATNTPLTISSASDIKLGTLSIASLIATDIDTNSISIRTGAGAGKVLVSDASGNGTWQTLSSGGTTTTILGSLAKFGMSYFAACGVADVGSTKCAGSFTSRNGTFYQSVTPIAHPDFTNIKSMAFKQAVGGDIFSAVDVYCAIMSDNTIKCAGGTQGNGIDYDPSIWDLSGLTGATSITVAAGTFSPIVVCGLMSDKTVKCAGGNQYGGLGDGTTTSRYTAAAVPGLLNVIQISGRGYHICALIQGGTMKCWGWGRYGELGDGTSGDYNYALTPRAVSGITTATQISTGYSHTCALLSDKTAKCWGYNHFGNSGYGSTTPYSFNNPGPLFGVSNLKQIEVGGTHTCALTEAGAVYCAGADTFGELGDGGCGSGSAFPTPTQVIGLSSGVRELGQLGTFSSLAIMQDGTTRYWGINGGGTSGNGNTDGNNTCVNPVQTNFR